MVIMVGFFLVIIRRRYVLVAAYILELHVMVKKCLQRGQTNHPGVSIPYFSWLSHIFGGAWEEGKLDSILFIYCGGGLITATKKSTKETMTHGKLIIPPLKIGTSFGAASCLAWIVQAFS